jgi:hypothetical protein
MENTATIGAALAAGADDDAINEMIREMLSTVRRTADDHDVMSWRRDNYLDLRRWAAPAATEYLDAQARVAAGGALALAGQAQLAEIYRRRLAADFRFPADPYVPDPDPVELPVGDE